MISLYACGGCGTNIAKQINDLDIDINYIDTSFSNLKDVKSSNLYILENIDGAGKIRTKTYDHFKDVAEDILIKFKPSPILNVVIASISGGSGSVIAPLVTKELIQSGHNTVVIAVDSHQSVKELDNSIKTLKTYKSISSTIKKSISVFYVKNSDRNETDADALRFIALLSLLVNKKHTEEFDTSDLSSFLEIDKVSDNAPSVTVLEVIDNEVVIPEKNTAIAATILITKNKNSSIKPAIPEYLSTCVISDPLYKNDDIRLNNILGKLSLIVDKMEQEIKELHDNKKLNKVKDLDITGSNSDGMVL